MRFIRQQEERLAMHLLEWQYKKMNLAIPDRPELYNQASKLVDEAHRIAREKGRDAWSIIKERIEDLKKHSSS